MRHAGRKKMAKPEIKDGDASQLLQGEPYKIQKGPQALKSKH